MKIKILPAFQIENLLPYDIIYQISDQNDNQDNRSRLEKGKIDTLYTVNPTNMLALQIKILETEFADSDVAIVTSTDLGYRDGSLTIDDPDGRPLRLLLKYSDNLEIGCRKITIYSPYVILNKTSLDMIFSAKSMISNSRIAAGQVISSSDDLSATDTVKPLMFSYSSYEPVRARAQMKAPDSDWSKPLSFEVVGHSFDAVLPVTGKNQELHFGVSVKEGSGKVSISFSDAFVVLSHQSGQHSATLRNCESFKGKYALSPGRFCGLYSNQARRVQSDALFDTG